MADIFPKSGLPIRRTVDLLPQVFKTETNSKFLSGSLDPLVQPGVLEKTVGYIGRRYGKTFNGKDIYLDNDETLRSRYQLEPGVIFKNNETIENFYDYIDFKNQLKFFNNNVERDDLVTSQDHYSWNPPIDWDKFINFREYYWVPEGPPSVTVLGQGLGITSTYRIRQGLASTWIFYPDGATNNPTITLYRGQTYRFEVNSPREGFTIRTSFDTGSLIYNPNIPYAPGQLAVFDGKLWRAKNYLTGAVTGTIEEGPDWELVEDNVQTSKFDYSDGVTNNGTTNGILEFEVPLDAPDVLFYQSTINPDRFGRFIIADIESNTKIDVEKEIIGKETYTSSNGVTLTNGLIVRFAGQVTPAKYAKDVWLVENVGRDIRLIKFSDLEVPIVTSDVPEVIFDNAGFDTDPFDDASSYPGEKDYVTICRASIDFNPWSRYNRWFHKSTLEYAHSLNNTDFESTETARAKRPIIEFRSDLQLFNHGSVAKTPVDFIDDFTDDVFSVIEGSQGYSIDGQTLFQGARILITADTDVLVNNKIFRVDFITHNGVRQIALRVTDDSEPLLGECVLVRNGNKNKGLMFHYNGTAWVRSQTKNQAVQPPLFDLFDENGMSFSDAEVYPATTFIGNKIISYQEGNGIVDNELGFSLKYLNIDNVGDILFNFDFDTSTFLYSQDQQTIEVKVNEGYFRFNPLDEFDNGWVKSDQAYLQPLLDSKVIVEETDQVDFETVDWKKLEESTYKLLLYINGNNFTNFTRDAGRFVLDSPLAKNDVVSLKLFSDLEPDKGYYQIPLGLEKNPFNQNLSSFTLGQAVDHISTALEVDERFVGAYPGSSNLRDIDNFQNRANRFLKHSGIAPMAISLLCDKNLNIIKSLQYSLRSYTQFKNEFLKTALTIDVNNDIPGMVDNVILNIGINKNSNDPFSDSDMIGSGAFTAIKYEVEDEDIKVFALSEKFDLATLSRRAVYVYLNNNILIHNRDYTFDSTFGFVRLSATLELGDQIEIREYVSTSFNYIPCTPTKLGLYKKFLPRKFIDDTYITPREVIQGHDGSITTCYGDYRDDLILELELRIYNNIKQEYNESIFDIDNILGGYYGNSLYGKKELDAIINQEFLKWISNSDIDFTDNSQYFDRENSFTYTYSNMTDVTGTVNLPGYWRGVYLWIYDTVRPHTCPWEMVGFTEKPTWWENEYGPAPYTSNNLILWEDIRDGIIRQGSRAGTYSRYSRPTILSHIPVDPDGNLLSPLDSGFATNFTLVNNNGKFNQGDISPAEYAWRSSSEYPFAVIIALTLLKPFEFITDSFDRSILKLNKLNQTVSKSSHVFFTIDDLVFPEVGGQQSSGLVNFIISYVKNQNLNQQVLRDKLDNIDVALSSRISGFVDQTEQKYLLDSKNPRSTTSSIFIPPENYDIIFNVSVPISSVAYSGVLIEKRDNGWRVRGYDNQKSYFNYFQPLKSTVDPLITVGGVSAKFKDWQSATVYNNGDIVRLNDVFYQAVRSHTSNEIFEQQNWKKLAKLPLTGGVDAFFRKSFNTLRPLQLSYGTVLNTIQDVVDFLLGYENYLKSQGLVFEKYDPETQTAYNWSTSAKEFMFWTKHNWAVGSLLTLSPAAQQVEISIPIGVADSLFDPFYDYEILKSDGTPLLPGFINVSRDFQNIKISTVNTNDGIFFIRVNFVLKEHVTVFDDRTVFNDVIYDKTTGYRQERIKSRGFRTVDWDGDYTSPGFLFDNVNIVSWQPFLDYRLGDIVSYKSFNWVSKENQEGSETFDTTRWEKLDSSPVKGLVPNFDYRINQFEDYFDVDADGLGSSQRELSRHVLGYQSREYLQNLAEDNVSQFKIYQGFIREKGTINSVRKIFDKLNNANQGGIDLYEEWAFRVGTFGGTEQFNEVEFKIFKDDLLLNPQPILVESFDNRAEILDQYLRVERDDFTIAPIPFTTQIIPTRKYELTNRTAGYVNLEDVDFVVANRDEITTLDILDVEDNSHIWVTFDDTSWTVLRLTSQTLLFITDISEADRVVTINLSQAHNLNVGDIFGVRGIVNLQGFFKIAAIPADDTIVVNLPEDADPPEWDSSTISSIELLVEARVSDYQSLNLEETAALKNGSKIWVDRNANNNWEVIDKKTSYAPTAIGTYGLAEPKRNGTAVVYSEALRQIFSSMPLSNAVGVYVERDNLLKAQQILLAPTEISSAVNNVFGDSLAVSPDGKWLAVGSPKANGVRTVYREIFDPASNYTSGDIVLYKGKLWRAKADIIGDGSTGPLTNQYDEENWEIVKILTTNLSEDVIPNLGYANQGVVTLYEYQNNIWNLRYSFVSPRQQTGELFGSKVSLSVDNGNYYMAVSAPGALNNLGRVYLFKYGQAEEIQGETITYTVTVGPPLFSDAGPQFYLNNQYRLRPDLVVGNTYVFDQSDLTNLYYPNPVTGTNITFVAGDFVSGRQYQINLLGNTDWISIGATPFATFVGSITGDQLTITAITTPGPSVSQRIVIGQQLSGVGVLPGTIITDFVSGTSGGVGVYRVNQLQLTASTLISAVNPGQTFTATGPGSGTGVASLFFTATNPQPLTFIDFDLSPYSFNVSYILDNRTVTRNQYISGFDTSIVRKVQITVTDQTDNLLYYVSSSAPAAINPLFKKFPTIAKEWQFLENENYKGIYQTGNEYSQGNIVWYDGKFWAARRTITGDQSTISIDEEVTEDWEIVTGIQTQNSLPTKLALKEADFDDALLGIDDSTLGVGLVDLEDSIEKIKEGDSFGHSLAMNRDGSVLVVGAPFSDGQFYASYKGVWRSFQEYQRDDVVKYEFNYYVLNSDTSTNEIPPSGAWSLLDSVQTEIKGKIFIYRRENDLYKLYQTIDSGTLDELSDIQVPYQIASGDQFGWSCDVDASGSTVIVSSPLADLDIDNQGSVYVFRFDPDSTKGSYRLKQKLQSYQNYSNESFGFNVKITDELDKIVVSSRNTALRLSTVFDADLDNYVTTFNEGTIYVGQVYVYELKDDVYILAEKLQVEKSELEDFGFSVDTASSVVVVGSPNYTVDAIKKGITRIFRKNPGETSLNKIREETQLSNIDLLKSLALFDDINNQKIADIDIVDGAKFKILGRADQEIKFKTPYDPAVYTNGTETNVVDPDTAWFEKQVGLVWWDISAAKWIYYEQDDIAYRTGNWNSLAYGASIEVYEWVESRYSPTEYSALADTAEGLSENISGQPVFGANVFSFKEFYNPSDGTVSFVRYYFWVKNKTVVPNNVPGRKISIRDVASLIENPAGSGLPIIGFISPDKLLAYNLNNIVREEYALVNLEFYKTNKNINLVHREYQLLVENVADSLPTSTLEDKWIDSLVGSNKAGSPVPDARLPAKQRYGISFRPSQTMFVDQQKALKITIDNINSVLSSRPFSDLIVSEKLNDKDSLPDPLANLYDLQIDTIDQLDEIGVARIRPASFGANIINGRVTSIQIIDPGFGYRVSPPLEIIGDGAAAKAVCAIDSQGRVTSVSIISEGRKYNNVSINVRNFSVLVTTDASINGFWAIYSWDNFASEWSRVISQSYDVSRYWSYIDWYANGVSSTTRISKEISNFNLEPTVDVENNEIIRIKEFGNGGWALLQKVDEGQGNIAGRYNLVGRENGTIEFSSSLYDVKQYDQDLTYDEIPYESGPAAELRILLDIVKNDIFVDDLRTEWNKLFFSSIRYVFSEQLYVDWAFKTSFINAIHNVGTLEKKTNYKSDNLESFQQYIEEVKPFRTTIREYTSRYTNLDDANTLVSDFDLPPIYEPLEGKIVPVNQNSFYIDQYPWKAWKDNQGYSVIEINLFSSGENYKDPPRVVIEGDGTGASAKAFVSNGRVSGITILNPGSNYTHAKVSLVGGNGSSQQTARAYVVLGDGKARSLNLGVKFDRITKTGTTVNFDYEQEFVADGFTSVFNLNYPPTRDKSKINVFINRQLILDSEYSITFYRSNLDSYTLLRGKLSLSSLPTSGDLITIAYEKNDEILDSVDRINKYYNPTAGMLGKELNQLMTGIDFGGVQIQGTTFDISGGWDALPWFTDNWDNVETNSDFYYATGDSANVISVTLPTPPDIGSLISIYLTRNNITTRIDDINFGLDDGSSVTNPNAVIKTFVGDGSSANVDIFPFLVTQPGDVLIFRPIESDGTLTINDINIIDTNLSGGSLSSMDGAYVTANGLFAEDIVVEGGKLISPDHVPAPEENIPGQFLDSVSIKIFHTEISGAAPLRSVVLTGDGETFRYDIGQTILDTNSLLVYIDKIKQGSSINDSSIDYEIDYNENEIVFRTPPESGAIIEIISVGLGGIALLDYQEFVADGETSLYLTQANFTDTESVLVLVNGVEIDVSFVDSTELIDAQNRTMIQFAIAPENRDVIKILVLGTALDTDSGERAVVRVNQQSFVYDGSTISFDLDRFVNLSRASAAGSILVEVNGRQLKGVDTEFVVYDGTNNVINVGVDPAEPPNSINSSNLKVYINNVLQRRNLDYNFNTSENVVTVFANQLQINDEIKIENDVRAQYEVRDNNLVVTASLVENDLINVIWFSEYPSMNLIQNQYRGGKNRYELERVPVSSSYVWVYKNGERLTQDLDYQVSMPDNSVYLKVIGSTSDEIKIVEYGNVIRREPSAFEIYKDMFNAFQFKRFSIDNTVTLTKQLNYYDTEIEISNAQNLFVPIKQRNIPGIIFVNGERIEYFEILGNKLKQLRRGSFGSAIPEIHAINSTVVDVSRSESLPYNEEQQKYNFISDGSTLAIGPLDFIPAVSAPTLATTWYRDTSEINGNIIYNPPLDHGRCDEIEVFVGGTRLRKDTVKIYDPELSVNSIDGDKDVPAEFTVDGITQFVRLTNAVPAGTRITIIKKTGKTWYDRGANTITSGKSLFRNESPVLKFISQKPTELPE